MAASSPVILWPGSGTWGRKSSYGVHGSLALGDSDKLVTRRFSTRRYQPKHCPIPLCPPNEGFCRFAPDWQTCDTNEIGVPSVVTLSEYQIRNFENDNPDSYIPKYLLEEHLNEEYKTQRHHRNNMDKERGSLAYVPLDRSSTVGPSDSDESSVCVGCLVHATGADLTELECNQLMVSSTFGQQQDSSDHGRERRSSESSNSGDSGDETLCATSTAVGCGFAVRPDSRYTHLQRVRQVLARNVRGHGVVGAMMNNRTAFYQINPGDAEDGDVWMSPYAVVESSEPNSAMDVSPHIFGEAMLLGEAGSFGLWNADHGLCPLRAALHSPTDSECHLWKSCSFTAHPRLAYLAGTKEVTIFDMRSAPRADTTLFSVASSPSLHRSECVSAMRQHPSMDFQLVLATKQTLVLLDQRYPKTPVLEWDYPWSTAPRFLSLATVDTSLTNTGHSAPTAGKDHIAMLSSCTRPQSMLYHFTDGQSSSSLPDPLISGGGRHSMATGSQSESSGVVPAPWQRVGCPVQHRRGGRLPCVNVGQLPMALGNCNVFPRCMSSPPALNGGVLQRLDSAVCGNALVTNLSSRGQGTGTFLTLQMTESGDVFSQLVQPVAAAESERCSGRSSPAHMDEVFFNSQRRRQQRGGHASTAGAGDDHDSDGSSSDRSSTEDGADSSVRDLLARTLDASCQEDCRSWLLHAKAHHRKHQPERLVQAPYDLEDFLLLRQYLNTEDAASKPLCIACFHDALPVVRGDSSFKHRKVNEALVTSRGIRTRRLHKGVRKSIHKWRKEALEEGSGVAPTCSVCRQPTGLGIKEVLHDERWYRLCTDRRQLSVDSHAVQTLARQQETESTADDVRPSPYAAPSHSGSSTPTKKRAQRASGARANARLAGQVAKRLSCQYLPHDQQQEEQQEQESVQGDCEPSQNLASEEESGEQRHLMDISEEDYEPLSRGEETDTERECDGVQQSTPRPPANDADLEVVEPSAKRVRHRDAGDLHVLSPVAFRQRTSSSSQDTASAGQAAWQGGEVAQPQYPLGAAMHVLTRSKPVDDAMDMLAQSGGADRRGRPKPKAIPLSQQALLPPSSDLPKCRKRQVAQRHWARGLRDYLLAERLKNKIGDKQKHLFSQLSQSLKSASGLDFDNLLEGQASEFVVVKKPRKSRSRLTRSMWCDWSRWSGQRRGWRELHLAAIPRRKPIRLVSTADTEDTSNSTDEGHPAVHGKGAAQAASALYSSSLTRSTSTGGSSASSSVSSNASSPRRGTSQATSANGRINIGVSHGQVAFPVSTGLGETQSHMPSLLSRQTDDVLLLASSVPFALPEERPPVSPASTSPGQASRRLRSSARAHGSEASSPGGDSVQPRGAPPHRMNSARASSTASPASLPVSRGLFSDQGSKESAPFNAAHLSETSNHAVCHPDLLGAGSPLQRGPTTPGRGRTAEQHHQDSMTSTLSHVAAKQGHKPPVHSQQTPQQDPGDGIGRTPSHSSAVLSRSSQMSPKRKHSFPIHLSVPVWTSPRKH
ncbi:uncharacterized protein LOC135825936 [Sycon ciliatum]|uniref:uncharacterized protein LOC135825936 n=1 Tax=Sycon ciliatum TaxID=27933 RepID=UPI0031F62E10